MSPMETGSACSIGLPLSRSQATRRPEGQLLTCRRKVVRSPASSVRSTWFHTCPFGSQKRAPAHSDCASVSARAGPSRICACSRYVVRGAVSVPSKPIFAWVPSQNGLVFEGAVAERLGFRLTAPAQLVRLPSGQCLALPPLLRLARVIGDDGLLGERHAAAHQVGTVARDDHPGARAGLRHRGPPSCECECECASLNHRRAGDKSAPAGGRLPPRGDACRLHSRGCAG